MKILFFALNSSYVHTNLAVRCLREALYRGGYGSEILERTLKDRRDGVLRELYEAEADIYGFSAYIWNADELYRYAASLKLLRPGARIVFGGPEVSFENEDFFAVHPYIDNIITGEGEDAWIALCRGETDGRLIRGGAYSAFTDTGILYDSPPEGRIVYYESSRGCPYRCAFCLSSLSGGVRAKSAQKTLADLLDFERFSGEIKIVKLVDRTFNFDVKRAKEIWRGLLSDEYTLSYHFEICASLLDDESFELLSRFPKGKIQLEIGIQSTNPRALEACRRRDDSHRVIDAARRIRSVGNIHVHCDLIAGLPFEDYDSFGRSFDDVYGCCDVLQLGFLKLLRGSALRVKAEQYGIVYEPSTPYSVLKTGSLGFEELARLRDIAAVLDRFANSGSFERAAAYISEKISSPFRFYEGLAGYITSFSGERGGIAGISQNTARELFYKYSVELSGIEEKILRSYMRFDFLMSENIAVPEFLRREDENRGAESSVLRDFLRDNGDKVFPSGTGAYSFEFDPSSVYIIDRRNRVYFKIGVQ